jgi:hypothetical protein
MPFVKGGRKWQVIIRTKQGKRSKLRIMMKLRKNYIQPAYYVGWKWVPAEKGDDSRYVKLIGGELYKMSGGTPVTAMTWREAVEAIGGDSGETEVQDLMLVSRERGHADVIVYTPGVIFGNRGAVPQLHTIT